MRRYLFPVFLALMPGLAFAQSATSVYVCAHPDDCFLFMSPNLYDDVVSEAEKVVIIYLTSGDAGLAFSKKTGDPATPYPYARELASLDATEWMADVDKTKHAQEEKDAVRIHGHAIDRVRYANTVSYFLRLPDGNFDGKGFAHYRNQSLRSLKSGESNGITPIDGRAPYRDWQDLVGVLSGIVTEEAADAKDVTLHISEPDTKSNYNDHSDHTTGASAVMEMVAGGRGQDRCYQVYKHIDYSIAERPVNLMGEALQNKAGSFAVLTATQRHFLDTHNWDKAHLPYVTRNYYTLSQEPQGCNTDR